MSKKGRLIQKSERVDKINKMKNVGYTIIYIEKNSDNICIYA